MRLLTSLITLVLALISFAEANSKVSFTCDNPPVTSASACYQSGITLLRHSCNLVGDPTAQQCTLQTYKRTTDTTWSCQFTSTNCRQDNIAAQGKGIYYCTSERNCTNCKKDKNFTLVDIPANHSGRGEMVLCVESVSSRNSSQQGNSNPAVQK